MSSFIELFDDFGIKILEIKLVPREAALIEERLNILPGKDITIPLADTTYVRIKDASN